MEHVVTTYKFLKWLCQCIQDPTAYICDLEETLVSLETQMESLMATCRDETENVEHEEKRQKKRTHGVDDWIKRVNSMADEVANLVAEGKEIGNGCPETSCPKNCLASYKLGKMAREKMDVVERMRQEGLGFREVAQPSPSPLAIKKPLSKTEGLDLLFEEVWRCLQDDNLTTIGIFGMGGIGKTTVLRMVNNKFLEMNLGLRGQQKYL
ncbi:hypothetical protein PVL29_026273 [Vitis rotundifolia]|uniref:NB-ARC domain-containing protein n=1 Tax=Vitis rotundifolia TaxID=103349 RepID=A0AA38YM24_VITRO|nr:hypothetical protein PVL29_026273 [Vitis rotundifolia]